MENKVQRTLILLHLLCATKQVGADNASSEHNAMRNKTEVVSHVQNLVEVEGASYAILRNDPNASLPASFTICSTIMAPVIFPRRMNLLFFNLLGTDGMPVFSWPMDVVMTSEGIVTRHNFLQQWKTLENDGQESYAFSHQWIKGCIAFDNESGLYHGVVDGIFVLNNKLSDHFLAKVPSDLSGKILLGKLSQTNCLPIISCRKFRDPLPHQLTAKVF